MLIPADISSLFYTPPPPQDAGGSKVFLALGSERDKSPAPFEDERFRESNPPPSLGGGQAGIASWSLTTYPPPSGAQKLAIHFDVGRHSHLGLNSNPPPNPQTGG